MVLADESIRIQKNVQHIGEIKAAFLVTRIAFIFIPFKFHGSMVGHWPTYVNARWVKGRPSIKRTKSGRQYANQPGVVPLGPLHPDC